MTLSLPVPERDPESFAPATPAALRAALAEQLAPIASLEASLDRTVAARLDASWPSRGARLPYPASEALAAAGDLAPLFRAAVDALERAGLASNRSAARARQLAHALRPLLLSWLVGESVPAGHARAVARRAAAIVGGAVLRRASALVRASAPRASDAGSCPCCGGAPDLAIASGTSRTFICARCDAPWESAAPGCLGCGATESPAFARLPAPHTSWSVAVCSPCGRFLKELDAPALPATTTLLIERALLEPVDRAAGRRGLRLQ